MLAMIDAEFERNFRILGLHVQYLAFSLSSKKIVRSSLLLQRTRQPLFKVLTTLGGISQEAAVLLVNSTAENVHTRGFTMGWWRLSDEGDITRYKNCRTRPKTSDQYTAQSKTSRSLHSHFSARMLQISTYFSPTIYHGRHPRPFLPLQSPNPTLTIFGLRHHLVLILTVILMFCRAHAVPTAPNHRPHRHHRPRNSPPLHIRRWPAVA